MTVLNIFFCFLCGIFLEMAMVHLFNYTETRHHPMISRAKSPHLASTLWGLGYLFFSGLILMLIHFKFEVSAGAAALFLGFAGWAIFLAVIAERRE
ncbi:MAG TPA: hypothetical protein VMT91_04770 [Anaerolineales bacterium]|nr:hypothetical protein [Anaerolineales bacterium]